MKNIYIFSGLGADKRVFQKMNFSPYNATFIDWITPAKTDSLESYARKLIPQIKHEKPIVIGLSFGGIMATEMAKIIAVEKIILIASAKTKTEIPYYFRLAGKLKLHRLLPVKLMKMPNFFSFWFFGTENKNDKKILREILKDTDENFLQWAIDKIVHWENKTEHQNLVHIHGDADRILPLKFVNCDIKIKNGGHFMTLNKSEALMEIVKSELM
jgi:pimeloyl-ACP methyl ester carboxylesterase